LKALGKRFVRKFVRAAQYLQGAKRGIKRQQGAIFTAKTWESNSNKQ
jgi:hypothetical protein